MVQLRYICSHSERIEQRIYDTSMNSKNNENKRSEKNVDENFVEMQLSI